MRKIIILLCCIAVFSSCERESVFGPRVIPYSLLFLIKENGVRLPDSVLNNMKLFYLQNGGKKYVYDLRRGINEGPFAAYDLGVQVTSNVGDLSAEAGIKNYFLEYPSGDIDTLFVNYVSVNTQQAQQEPCFCYYPLREVKFNGVAVGLDTSIYYQTVYGFEKR